MKGASVLDVGCGTGILSMFAAEGGATKVIGMHTANCMILMHITAADCVASISPQPVMHCRMLHGFHYLCSSHIAGKSNSARCMSYTTWLCSMTPVLVTCRSRWQHTHR